MSSPSLVGPTAREAPPRDLALDLMVLAGVAALLLFAAALEVERDDAGRDQVLIGAQAMPALCLFHRVTGLSCPTCGVTRSVVSCVHGDLPRACGHHPFGPVIVLLAALQVPYRTVVVLHRKARRWRFPARWRDRLIGWTAALLAGSCVLKLLS